MESQSRSLVLFISLLSLGLPCVIAVVATEVTIRWNKIRGVDSLDSVSQLVPFVIGLGQLLYVLYRSVAKPQDDNEDEDEDESG
jgi:hypothetical protein